MTNMDIVKDFRNFEEENCYTSQMEFRNYKLEWIIENFEAVCKSMKFIESPMFPARRRLEDGEWYIHLDLAELNEESENEISIYLFKTTNSPIKNMFVTISLLNSITDKGITFVSPIEDVVYEWHVNSSELFKSLLSDDLMPVNVKVVCKVRVFCSLNNVLQKSPSDSPKFESLVQKMDKLYLDQDFKDVTFMVQKKKFQAHKAILALQSPVFAAMFKSKMSEELTKIVEIEDINSITFEKMLRFIYTDNVENLDKFAFELFYAAEKYQLNKLKIMCINTLCENISLETVVEILELADIYSISTLKNKSIKYLISNLNTIKETENYVKLLKDRSHLTTEIVEVVNEIKIENAESEKCCKLAVFEFRKNN